MPRMTLAFLENFAAQNGWHIEKAYGKGYDLWKVNDRGVGPIDGTTVTDDTLTDAYSTIYYDRNLPTPPAEDTVLDAA